MPDAVLGRRLQWPSIISASKMIAQSLFLNAYSATIRTGHIRLYGPTPQLVGLIGVARLLFAHFDNMFVEEIMKRIRFKETSCKVNVCCKPYASSGIRMIYFPLLNIAIIISLLAFLATVSSTSILNKHFTANTHCRERKITDGYLKLRAGLPQVNVELILTVHILFVN